MLKQMEVLTAIFLNKGQQRVLDMQKKNVINTEEEEEHDRGGELRRRQTTYKARLREECIFGQLGEMRECIEYFK